MNKHKKKKKLFFSILSRGGKKKGENSLQKTHTQSDEKKQPNVK
jgi:hypothetical protein